MHSSAASPGVPSSARHATQFFQRLYLCAKEPRGHLIHRNSRSSVLLAKCPGGHPLSKKKKKKKKKNRQMSGVTIQFTKLKNVDPVHLSWDA